LRWMSRKSKGRRVREEGGLEMADATAWSEQPIAMVGLLWSGS
jgi:hypothetical protein